MNETYKFYVQMDGHTFGPYTARAIRELDLLDDILVTEESMNGQWLPASILTLMTWCVKKMA